MSFSCFLKAESNSSCSYNTDDEKNTTTRWNHAARFTAYDRPKVREILRQVSFSNLIASFGVDVLYFFCRLSRCRQDPASLVTSKRKLNTPYAATFPSSHPGKAYPTNQARLSHILPARNSSLINHFLFLQALALPLQPVVSQRHSLIDHALCTHETSRSRLSLVTMALCVVVYVSSSHLFWTAVYTFR